jgi:energy-converting hydrogenase B subunit D
MILEIAIVGIVLLSVILVELRDLLHAIIFLATGDMLLAVVFFLLGAPDIALTQASVATGLSTLLFILAINRTHRREGVEE